MNMIFDTHFFKTTVLVFGTTGSAFMAWKLEVLTDDICILLEKKGGQKNSICPSKRCWELLWRWFGKRLHLQKTKRATALKIVGQSLYFNKTLLRFRNIARFPRTRNEREMFWEVTTRTNWGNFWDWIALHPKSTCQEIFVFEWEELFLSAPFRQGDAWERLLEFVWRFWWISSFLQISATSLLAKYDRTSRIEIV